VPAFTLLLRTSVKQRSSQHVIGQVGCFAPILALQFCALLKESRADARVLVMLLKQLQPKKDASSSNSSNITYFVLAHHPGRHAAPTVSVDTVVSTIPPL